MRTTSKSPGTLQNELAALQRQFRRRKADRQFEEGGGVVYYGLDSDVITMITGPWLDNLVVSNLFTDSQEAESAFAFLFGEFFFKRDPGDRPFLIVSPTENEIEGLWNKVYENAFGEIADIVDVELRFGAIARLSDNELFEFVRKVVTAVHGAYSSVAELRRINRLVQSGSILRMDSVLTPDGVSPFSSLGSNRQSEFQEIQQRWLHELGSVRRSRPDSNQIDSAVLARVELENRILRSADEPVKLCLVTGDSYIAKVASEVMLPGGLNFERHFIRAPSCFLADSDFFDVVGVLEPLTLRDDLSSQTQPSLAQWFERVLLYHFHRQARRNTKRRFSVELTNACTKWSQYLRSAGATIQISKEELDAKIRKYSRASASINTTEFELLRERVRAVGREAALGFAASAALSRFWSLDPKRAPGAGRGVPGVRFDSFPKASMLTAKLTQASGLVDAQLRLDRTWISALRTEDESGYTVLVTIALAFAFAGEWATALTVSTFAHALAQRARSFIPHCNVKGDEAAYLCAVFSRLSAKTLGDLSKSSDWLDEAEHQLNAVPLRKSLGPLRNDTFKDSRFEAERLAIRLARFLFAKFADTTGTDDLRRGIAASVSLIDLAVSHLRQLNGLPEDLPSHIRTYVEHQLVVNLLQTEILRAIDGNLDGAGEADARWALERVLGTQRDQVLLNHIESLERATGSNLIPFLYICGVLLFSQERVSQEMEEVFLTKLDLHAAALKVMPYDPMRARGFADFVRRRIKASNVRPPYAIDDRDHAS